MAERSSSGSAADVAEAMAEVGPADSALAVAVAAAVAAVAGLLGPLSLLLATAADTAVGGMADGAHEGGAGACDSSARAI